VPSPRGPGETRAEVWTVQTCLKDPRTKVWIVQTCLEDPRTKVWTVQTCLEDPHTEVRTVQTRLEDPRTEVWTVQTSRRTALSCGRSIARSGRIVFWRTRQDSSRTRQENRYAGGGTQLVVQEPQVVVLFVPHWTTVQGLDFVVLQLWQMP
jgi:hypothetical protein